MQNREWTLDDLSTWQAKGLEDRHDQMKKAYDSLKQSPDLAHLNQFCTAMKKIISECLDFVFDEKSNEYLLLKAFQGSLYEIIDLFTATEKLEREFWHPNTTQKVVVQLPKADQLNTKTPICTDQQETARIFYNERIGFLRLKPIATNSSHWQLNITPVCTFDTTTQKHQVHKWILLANFEMFLIDHSSDERLYTKEEPILFCGEVTFNDGQLTHLSPSATHYPITVEQTFLLLMLLEKKIGIDIADIKMDPQQFSQQSALDLLDVRLSQNKTKKDTEILDEFSIWLLCFAMFGFENRQALIPTEASLIATPNKNFNTILAVAAYGLNNLFDCNRAHPVVTKAFKARSRTTLELLQIICRSDSSYRSKSIERKYLASLLRNNITASMDQVQKRPGERQHLFYCREQGFIQLTEHDTIVPWQMQFKPVSTNISNSKELTEKKFIVCGDKTMLLLELEDDERQFMLNKQVLFCGEAIVENGHLLHLTNYSRYIPMSVEQLLLTVMQLEKFGIVVDKLTLTLHEQNDNAVSEVATSVVELLSERGKELLLRLLDSDKENIPLWKVDEFWVWLLLKCVSDPEKELQKAFRQLSRLHNLHARVESFKTISVIAERRIVKLTNTASDEYSVWSLLLSLFKNAPQELLTDFNELRALNRTDTVDEENLVVLPEKQQSPTRGYCLIDQENKRIFYCKTKGFLRLKYYDAQEPWQMSIYPVTTFKDGTNIPAANKFVMLADRSMYILFLNEDECEITLGKPILFCGEAKFVDGVLTEINNVSNRYPMQEEQLTLMLKVLECIGVDISTVNVSTAKLSEQRAIEVLDLNRSKFSKWTPKLPGARSPRRNAADPNDATSALMTEPVKIERTRSVPLFKQRNGKVEKTIVLKKNSSRGVEVIASQLQKRYSHESGLRTDQGPIEPSLDAQVATFFALMFNWANQFQGKTNLLPVFISFLVQKHTELKSDVSEISTPAKKTFQQDFTYQIQLFNSTCEYTTKQETELKKIMANAPWVLYAQNKQSPRK